MDKNKKKKIKVTVARDHKKSSQEDLTKSGPQVNDIRNRSSRWRSLPAKNVVKIKEEQKKKSSAASSFCKGLFFILIGMLGLVVISSYLYWQFFAVRGTAAALVPADALVYGQININGVLFPDKQKDKPLASLAERIDPLLDKGTSLIDEKIEPLGVRFVTDIKPFLGKNFYFSYFPAGDEIDQDGNKTVTPDWVFIVDVFDRTAADNMLRKMGYRAKITREDYQGVEIISIRDEKGDLLTNYLFIDDYLVVSYSRAHLQMVIKTYQEEYSTLAQSTKLKNYNPLTLRKKFLYLYLQPAQLTSYVPQVSNLYVLWGMTIADLQGMLITMEAKEGGVLFNMVAQRSEDKTDQRISQELMDHLAVDTSAFIAGHNLDKDLAELKQDLASKSPTAEFHLNNFLRSIEERARINLAADLFKYLDDEYVLVFDHADGKTNYSFIFKLKDVAKAKAQATILEEAVTNYLGSVYPIKKEMTLSDGSKAEELFPDQESFKFTDLDFTGRKVRSVTNDNLSDNFSYVIMGDKLLVSTSLESLKSLLVASNSKTSGKLLANKRYFSLPNSEATNWQSESIFYTDVSDLADYLNIKGTERKYFEPFDTALFSFSSQNKKVIWQGFLYTEQDK